jgi:hypothetical protein
VGRDCHIGAGAVLAGVLEPPSAEPVVIEDEVLIGANAVVLEGVRVGKGSVVAAGAVVVHDVPPLTVVAGQPARVIKEVDQKTKDKTGLLKEAAGSQAGSPLARRRARRWLAGGLAAGSQAGSPLARLAGGLAAGSQAGSPLARRRARRWLAGGWGAVRGRGGIGRR